jgi:translation initiation factor IF-3
VPEVRLVGEDGKQIGVIKTADALSYAQERDLDLVEVAPDARPPVCRVLDYSKYKYEQAQKQKAARKHQQQITIREIKFRPKIAQNDYDTKKGHVARFLRGHDKVKVTIMFRGREVTHPERGTALLDRLATELSDIAVIEQTPLQDGRNMTMLLAPSKAVLAVEKGKPIADAEDQATGNGAGPAATDEAPDDTNGATAATDETPADTDAAPVTADEASPPDDAPDTDPAPADPAPAAAEPPARPAKAAAAPARAAAAEKS